MNLTWHIVRKDLRRMAWTVAALVASSAGTEMRFALARVPETLASPYGVDAWIGEMDAYGMWVAIMLGIVGALLAGHLVQDDVATGSTAFWRTRPIGGGRMLAAKVISAALLLAVAPTLARTLVWMASGFSMAETAVAAGEALLGVMWLAPVLAVAALTSGLGTFVIASVGVAVLLVFTAIPAPWTSNLGPAVEQTRIILQSALPVLLMAGVLAHQYLTRRTRIGWVLVAGTLVATHAVRVAWPWDLMPLMPAAVDKTWPKAAVASRESTAVTLESFVISPGGGGPAEAIFRVAREKDAELFLVPLWSEARLTAADGRVTKLALAAGAGWGEDAARRIVGDRRDDGPVSWRLALRPMAGGNAFDTTGPLGFSGDVRLAWMRGRVQAEVPVREGAAVQEGASELRIVRLAGGGRVERASLLVEERDALRLRNRWLNGPGSLRERDDSRRDGYLLVNRARGTVEWLRVIERGAADLGARLVSVRQLETGGEMPAGWEDGAVLIRVRFELERRLSCEVNNGRVALVAEEEKK